MRTEALVLIVIGAFFAVLAAIYWFWSYEQSGTAMLIGSGFLGLVPGAYYFWWSKRMRPRPEDRPEGTLEEGAGVVGTFPSTSVWPFVLGLAATLVAFSLVFGFWTAILGFTLAISAVVGIILESRRGGYV